MSPPFHRFVESERSQCSLLHSQVEGSKPKGGKSLELGPGNLGSEAHWCAQSHSQGGDGASGAPVPSWLKIPWASAGWKGAWWCLAGLRGRGGGWGSGQVKLQVSGS